MTPIPAKKPGNPGTFYGKLFYDFIEQVTLKSANVIVPAVVRLLNPRSVLDVGCGLGIWLKVFQEHGVSVVKGIDGNHVRPEWLRIREDCFNAVDLSRPFSVEERFDLVLCLEVAEHLPAEMGESLVTVLTAAAPIVLFSAAIPGQGGQHHVNEQWPTYWHGLFAAHGYELFDPFRPLIREDRSVAQWYRQNILVYVSRDYALEFAARSNLGAVQPEFAIEWVHVTTYIEALTPDQSLRAAFANLRRAIRPIPYLALKAAQKRLRSKFNLNGGHGTAKL